MGRLPTFDGERPDASWNLAWSNFQRQGMSIVQQATEPLRELYQKNNDTALLRLPAVLGLRLSNADVTAAEDLRIATTGGVPNVHPVSLGLYKLGCAMLDTLFDERPIPRFWFLEIVARIPYFSYVSMLHLYESLGWWRAVELRKVHAAEEWNELHHLLIMESLGGNSAWSDRFLGYHAALVYYWLLNLVFLGSPRIAYQFMELLESHAVDTYTTFCQQNKDVLERLPPPQVAVAYYAAGDLYLFDGKCCTSRGPQLSPSGNDHSLTHYSLSLIFFHRRLSSESRARFASTTM
jgi:Alternative oxidase